MTHTNQYSAPDFGLTATELLQLMRDEARHTIDARALTMGAAPYVGARESARALKSNSHQTLVDLIEWACSFGCELDLRANGLLEVTDSFLNAPTKAKRIVIDMALHACMEEHLDGNNGLSFAVEVVTCVLGLSRIDDDSEWGNNSDAEAKFHECMIYAVRDLAEVMIERRDRREMCLTDVANHAVTKLLRVLHPMPRTSERVAPPAARAQEAA